jgi:hypothetical protein
LNDVDRALAFEHDDLQRGSLRRRNDAVCPARQRDQRDADDDTATVSRCHGLHRSVTGNVVDPLPLIVPLNGGFC